MAQFQAQRLDRSGLLSIVRVINNSLDDKRKIESGKLITIFEKWFDDFENAYTSFKSKYPKKVERDEKKSGGVLDESEQIGEILNAVRRLERKMGNFEKEKNAIEYVTVGSVDVGVQDSGWRKPLFSRTSNPGSSEIATRPLSINSAIPNTLSSIATNMNEFQATKLNEDD